ncbi:MAG TPA: ABC transporter permease [Ktedonobacteraceae bacterium]|jgi:ABC-2 type transport system permease protein|nr:ABC transporter permease [Ktedonobacteraceae bacterium]
MSALTPSSHPQTFHPHSNTRAALTAFLAIVSRDLLMARREIVTFLLQTLIQPLFYLFVFGKVLPLIGSATGGFSMLLLPGMVAFTLFLTALQTTSTDLGRDLGVLREIDDRLLAPLPTALVALEKVLFAAVRGFIAGTCLFPLAFWILGNGYQVRTDHLVILIGLMVLVALVGAALGLLLGTVLPLQQLALVFALVLTPLIFTGCTFYPWISLGALKWFQVLTLFNPLTYASEGMRFAMLPPVHGQELPTLALGWVLLVLCTSLIVSLWGGIRFFHRRVIG